jgi:hypothetical protein
MRQRLPLFVLLASALTFLVSLFLPWVVTRSAGFAFAASGSDQGIVTLLEGGHVEGWVGNAGDAAVLLVIAIVIATIATLRRPLLAARLPIGGLGVALGYFAVAVAVNVHRLSGLFVGGFTGHPPTLHRSWTYGFYLGVASGGLALLSGLAYRRNELLRSRRAADLVALALGIALLVAFLLPWSGFSGPDNNSIHGIEVAAAAVAALGLIVGAGWLQEDPRRRWRLPLAIATAILTGGVADAVASLDAPHLYGTWLGVACAVLLVAVEAVRAWPVRRAAPPAGPAAVRIGAAALLIVALFLPWQGLNVEGVTVRTIDGWYWSTGAAAGSLCLVLLASQALPALEGYVLDAVVAIVIFVSALATGFREQSFAYRIGYGAYVGIAAAGVLLVTALMRLRPGHVDASRARARAAPLAASVLCVAVVVVPSWFVLPEGWDYPAAPLSGFLAVPGVLISLYLIRLWALQVRGPAATGNRLTLVPLVLLALPALELIRFRSGDVIWGAVILIALCLLLAVLGWVEEDRGLENLRVPETRRVDPLPEVES